MSISSFRPTDDMLNPLFVVSALALNQTGPSQGPPPPATDGQYQPAVEANYSFECRAHRFGLRYRQERTPFDAIASEESLRVTLLELTAGGASMSSADLARVRELFRSFAWVQEVKAQCFGDELDILVWGMPLRPFLASLDHERPNPQLNGRSFRLSTRGIAYLSPQAW